MLEFKSGRIGLEWARSTPNHRVGPCDMCLVRDRSLPTPATVIYEFSQILCLVPGSRCRWDEWYLCAACDGSEIIQARLAWLALGGNPDEWKPQREG